MPDSSQQNLFGVLDSSSNALPLGDNVHDLSDKQLAKLVQLKFHNDPFRLVRQLSRDLAYKETELILLRKEKFQREQELVRLCMAYGNLSALEVDQHLEALPIEENAQKVVSQLIKSAMNEDVTPGLRSSKTTPAKRLRRRLPATVPLELSKSSASRASLQSSTATRTISPTSEESGPGRNVLADPAKGSHTEDKKSHWFDWLNRAEDLHFSESATSLNSRLRSLSLTNFRTRNPKRPVELQSIGDSDFIATKHDNTDKYGFYTDIPPLSHKNLAPEIDSMASTARTDNLVPTATISRHEPSESIDRLKHLGQLYDAQNVENNKRWDHFMHGVHKEKLKELQEEDSQLFGIRALNLKRSESRLAKFFISGEDETLDDSYKALLRLVHESGIPPKYRNALWFELSGAKNREVRGEYQRLVELSHASEDPTILNHLEQLSLDLHRTLPSNSFFNDMPNGQPGPQYYKLQNILRAFVTYKPEIGYAQGMNKVVGNLLLGANESNSYGLHILSEEDVFWIFVSLTEDFVPTYGQQEYFHPGSLPLIQQDVALVQSEYFPKHLPKLFAHLEAAGVEIQMILLRWWLGIFTECFSSMELWFKIFDDMLLGESAEVKFVCYSLAIFKLFERGVLDLSDADDIYRLLSNLNMQVVSQTNIRFRDLIELSAEFEKQISAEDFERKRKSAYARSNTKTS